MNFKERPVPPCFGKSELFDSTDLNDHIVARSICEKCPMIAACGKRLAEASFGKSNVDGPEGTWAGKLIGVPKKNKAATDEAVGCETCGVASDEQCRTRNGMRSGIYHAGRKFARTCGCGAEIEWKRKKCEACVRANRLEAKRRWHERNKAATTDAA